ncbi:hypothetical protein HU200_035415 [Digitaria exilis]|uniref:Uncharacterized protein n=1 Tax=Digitaria exilis TaxID=1010633 RepID=A0A835BKB1_9POAL|nr:hypothetical protein HU200_037357 [Digitaria exilis]KAF8697918.1 hypothetical protein HU200_035415 [Digitaria exilis]CAB3502646.1 unnamed protein product [Digitaria exilis]
MEKDINKPPTQHHSSQAITMATIAFNGLCVGIAMAFLLSILSQSSPGEIDGALQAPGNAAAQAIPLAVATFFTAVTFIYIHLLHGGRRMIQEVMLFILCVSISLLDLSLTMQPGPVFQAPALVAAMAEVLPLAAVATFFLAVTLIYYAHGNGGHDGAAGAANQQNPAAAVELLNSVTLAATLITGVLGLIAAVLYINPK